MAAKLKASKWDNPNPSSPLRTTRSEESSTVSSAVTNSMEKCKTGVDAAAEAAARINAMLVAKGVLKPSQLSSSKTVNGSLVVSEVDINDVSPSARLLLTKTSTQEEILKFSGATVSTRGRFLTEEEKRNIGTKNALYLHVQGPDQTSVDKATAKIKEMIESFQRKRPSRFSSVAVTTSSVVTSTITPATTSSSSSGLAFVQEKVFVGMENVKPAFDIRNKLLGPNGMYLLHIQAETGAKVTLRGLGSGHIEITSGREAFEPLHIHIQHANIAGLQNAKKLAESLIETVRSEYVQWEQALAAMPPTISAGTASLLAGLQQHQPYVQGGVRPCGSTPICSLSSAASVNVLPPVTGFSASVPPVGLGANQFGGGTSVPPVGFNNSFRLPHTSALSSTVLGQSVSSLSGSAPMPGSMTLYPNFQSVPPPGNLLPTYPTDKLTLNSVNMPQPVPPPSTVTLPIGLPPISYPLPIPAPVALPLPSMPQPVPPPNLPVSLAVGPSLSTVQTVVVPGTSIAMSTSVLSVPRNVSTCVSLIVPSASIISVGPCHLRTATTVALSVITQPASSGVSTANSGVGSVTISASPAVLHALPGTPSEIVKSALPSNLPYSGAVSLSLPSSHATLQTFGSAPSISSAYPNFSVAASAPIPPGPLSHIPPPAIPNIFPTMSPAVQQLAVPGVASYIANNMSGCLSGGTLPVTVSLNMPSSVPVQPSYCLPPLPIATTHQDPVKDYYNHYVTDNHGTKRRFTEEKEDDRTPTNLLGYEHGPPPAKVVPEPASLPENARLSSQLQVMGNVCLTGGANEERLTIASSKSENEKSPPLMPPPPTLPPPAVLPTVIKMKKPSTKASPGLQVRGGTSSSSNKAKDSSLSIVAASYGSDEED